MSLPCKRSRDFDDAPDRDQPARIAELLGEYYWVVDTWVQAGHSRDEGATWYDDDLRIDYGFVSARLAAQVTKAWVDETADGSDHQPVWFELDL